MFVLVVEYINRHACAQIGQFISAGSRTRLVSNLICFLLFMSLPPVSLWLVIMGQPCSPQGHSHDHAGCSSEMRQENGMALGMLRPF